MELSKYFEKLVDFLQKFLTKPIYITIGGKKLKKTEVIPTRAKIIGIIIAVSSGTVLFLSYLIAFQSLGTNMSFKDLISVLEFFSFILFLALLGATIHYYGRRLLQYKKMISVLSELLIELLFIIIFNFAIGFTFYMFVKVFPSIFLVNYYFMLFLFLNFFFGFFVTDYGFELVKRFLEMGKLIKNFPEYIATAFVIDIPILFFVLSAYIVKKYKISFRISVFFYIFDLVVLFSYLYFLKRDSVMITSDYENFMAIKKSVTFALLVTILFLLLGVITGMVK